MEREGETERDRRAETWRDRPRERERERERRTDRQRYLGGFLNIEQPRPHEHGHDHAAGPKHAEHVSCVGERRRGEGEMREL